MRLSSRAPLPARDPHTPWLQWAATSSYSEAFFGRVFLVRRHAALAGHHLGAYQRLRWQLFRALLLCARGRMVSSGGAVPGLDGAIEHVVYFSQILLRICWCTLRHE